MPVTKRDGKYYWGSKGPFDSRKEAQAVQRAAFASGYEKMVGNPVGASDEGVKPNTAQDVADREKRLTKEDGAATVFTSSDAGIFTPTHGGHGVHSMSRHQQKKKKKRSGPEKVAMFLDDKSPHTFTKELQALKDFEKSAFPSDNFESQNRMNNPKRLDWQKKKANDAEKAVAHTHNPPAQFYKDRGASYSSVAGGPANQQAKYVERDRNRSGDREKWGDYTLAHQDDMEKKIRGYDKESKKRHGDADEPPGHALGGAAGQIDHSGINKMEGSSWTRDGAQGVQDSLHRGGDKDKISRRKNEKPVNEDRYEESIVKSMIDDIRISLQKAEENEMS